MKLDNEIYLNQLAQGVLPVSAGVEWFGQHEASDQLDILRSLYYFVIQSGATKTDAENAVALSGLRASYTPCVLIVKGRISEQISKILQLPKEEYTKSFRLLVSLLSISDAKRRAGCGEDCSHWWHRDLSQEDELQRIRMSQCPGPANLE
jgi:hypothetical protein